MKLVLPQRELPYIWFVRSNTGVLAFCWAISLRRTCCHPLRWDLVDEVANSVFVFHFDDGVCGWGRFPSYMASYRLRGGHFEEGLPRPGLHDEISLRNRGVCFTVWDFISMKRSSLRSLRVMIWKRQETHFDGGVFISTTPLSFRLYPFISTKVIINRLFRMSCERVRGPCQRDMTQYPQLGTHLRLGDHLGWTVCSSQMHRPDQQGESWYRPCHICRSFQFSNDW